jgi:hypothetical protein
MSTPQEQQISVPAQDSRQAALQLVIPAVGVIAIAAIGAAGIAVYWQATGKDREEVLRIGAEKLGQYGGNAKRFTTTED